MFVVLRALAIVLPPVQGAPLDLVAIKLWGWSHAFVLAECGIMLGAIGTYGLGRTASAPLTRWLPALERVQRWEQRLGQPRWLAWLALRLASNPLFDLLGYAAGLLRVPFPMFCWTTLVGNVPTMLLFYLAAQYAFGYGWIGVTLFVAGFGILTVLLARMVVRREP